VGKELIAVRYRTAALVAVVASVAATLAPGAPASADVKGGKGVTLSMTQPATFISGGAAGELSVTASSTDQRRPGCRKVRWTLVVQVQGVRLDQVRVKRLEGAGDFPVLVQAAGDTARITDQRFDTGSLCGDKTDTAAYAIAVTGGTGALAFRSEPHDAAGRLLSTATSESTVVRDDAAAPPPPSASAAPSSTAGPSPSAEPSPSESDDAVAPPAAPPVTTPPATALIPAGVKDHSPSLLGPGLIVGGLLVLFGVGLLLRVRRRSRRDPRGTPGFPPASFHPTYR
jgi:hypothetical protein